MNNWLCDIFGHKWRKGWAGAESGPFGAIVINYKTCNRCGKSEHEFSTHIEIKDVTL